MVHIKSTKTTPNTSPSEEREGKNVCSKQQPEGKGNAKTTSHIIRYKTHALRPTVYFILIPGDLLQGSQPIFELMFIEISNKFQSQF